MYVHTYVGSTVRNLSAFQILQDVFLASGSSHLCCSIVDAILNIYRSDPANYFILKPLQTVSLFLEVLPQKSIDIQVT